MPLTRLAVRNQFGLGDPKLYSCNNRENSKAVLDGVAVAGLVGILRQLGDLAEFAADVFHHLHEEVTITAARGRKLFTRIQNIETAFPSAEKSIEQQGRIIDAYIAGTEWHPHPRDDQNVILSTDLPPFMIDSYEACRDAPRLYLLDKFDHDGSGACLKRFSDPSFFRRVLVISELEKAEYTSRQKKFCKVKKKGSRAKHKEMHPAVQMSSQDSRKTFSSPSVDGQNFWADTASMPDCWLNPEIFSRSTSFASKTKESHNGGASDVNFCPNEITYAKVPVSNLRRLDASISDIHLKPIPDMFADFSHGFTQDQTFQQSSSATWYRKNETIPTCPASYDDMPANRSQDPNSQYSWEFDNMDNANAASSRHGNRSLDTGKLPVSLDSINHFVEVMGETYNYTDAYNTLKSEVETETVLQNEREEKLRSELNSQVKEYINEANLGAKVQTPVLCGKEAPDTLPVAARQVVSQKYSDFYSSGQTKHVELPHCTDISPNQEHTDIMDSNGSNMRYVSKSRDHVPFHGDCIPEMGISSTQAVVGEEEPIKKSNLKSPLSSMLGLPLDQLWTNGELFGVDPSKPPYLGQIRASNGKLLSDCRNSASNLYSCTTKSHNEGGPISKEKTVRAFSSFSSLSLNSANGNDPGHAHPLKQSISLIESGKSLELSSISDNHSSCGPAGTKSSVVGLETNDTTATHPGSTQSIKVIRSKFSDIAQRFITNTIQRKSSITAAGRTSAPIEITNVCEKKGDSQLPNYRNPSAVISEAAQRMVTRENVYAIPFNTSTYSNLENSGQYSPPLEHIKVSFCPMYGLETSKLQPDVSRDCYQGSDDFLLPSFTRSKGSIHPDEDSCSDSDDDTFGRSCPYSSDDLLSPGSCSNSVMWGQEERSEYKGSELRNDPCRSPSTTLPISSCMMEKANLSSMNVSNEMHSFHSGSCKTSFISGSPADLPGLDSISLFGTIQGGGCSLADDTLHLADCKLPAPPPLPPVKWRVSKAPIAAISNNAGYLHAHAQQFSSQLEDSGSFTKKIEELDQQLMNGCKLNDGSKMAKEVVGREELLDKIRSKSFCLRQTKRAKPDDIPSSVKNVANANVVAILEKATALRQAFVGNDGGNDDKWSDG